MKHSLITRDLNKNLIDSFFNKDELFMPMENLFNSVFKNQFPELMTEFDIDFDKTAYPKVNVKETKENFQIIAEIPGIEKENVNIEYDIQTGVLKLQGDKKVKNIDEKESDNVKWIRKEIKQSSFTRCFYIKPELIDNLDISASYNDNYLHITIPKKEKLITKDAKFKIEIK